MDSGTSASRSPYLGEVGETLQYRIAARRLEPRQDPLHEEVDERRGVPHVEIERRELATEVQLRIVIEGAADIPLQPARHAPRQEVAQRMKVQVQVECDAVVEAEVLVVERVAVHHAEAEGDGLPCLAPDEEAHLVG